ncbi:MAG: aminotransferase class IV [Leucobacter sp.]
MSAGTHTRERDELMVADSFRVRRNAAGGTAEVRGWQLHRERFTSAVREVCEMESFGTTHRVLLTLDDFLQKAAEQIADYGEGFPRLELRRTSAGDPKLSVALRPLPALGTTLELRSAPGIQLSRPHLKGPNIVRLGELNRTFGAEALLLDPAGNALEGATSSLIWWSRDTTEGHVVSQRSGATTGDRVPSVTESLLRSSNDRITGARAAPAELAQHEVWAVNALHGIRRVTSIDGTSLPAPDIHRLNTHAETLDSCWEAVTSP